MSYEQKDPRLLKEVGDLILSVFANQIGLLYRNLRDVQFHIPL